VSSAQSLLIEVQHGDTPRVALEVDAAVARLGRGAHCEVQLCDPKVLPTHLELEARDGVIFASATVAEAAVWVNGRPFHSGALPVGATLRVGDTELGVSLRDHWPRVLRLRRAQRLGVSGLLVLLLGVAGARLWAVPVEDVASRLEARAWPVLLDADWLPDCPERDPERILGHARDSERAARALRERMPFFPGDGIRAVVSLEQAAACYALADHSPAAREARRVAALLHDRVVADYRMHQVGLAWSLHRKDWAAIRGHSSELLALATVSFGATDPLVEWLGELQRRAEQNEPSRAPRK
jgi:hypothetical protein